MTTREIYEKVLLDLKKNKTSSILLEEFNHTLNKCINQFVNLLYKRDEMDQQNHDDFKSLKTPGSADLIFDGSNTVPYPIYLGDLPSDYLHIESCTIVFDVLADFGCYKKDTTYTTDATYLTENMKGTVNKNYYFKPSYTKPYFYILRDLGGSIANSDYTSQKSIIQIWAGESKIFKPKKVYFGYVKYPIVLELTEEQLDDVIENDTSQVMEFDNNVCYRIIGQMMKVLLESTSNPRVQSYTPINQSVVSSTQQTK